MAVSRRSFVADVSVLGLLAAFAPEIAEAQTDTSKAPAEDAPHDSYEFWDGFFDSVNPSSRNYGKKEASRGPRNLLPDPGAETQYLHYKAGEKKLRNAIGIGKEELLDHDGDVAISISFLQYRPSSSGEANNGASQLRLDATQIYPCMSILPPLAWTAIASLTPDKTGKVSLEQLGFRSNQATQGMRNIVLTRGMGKLAVNLSMAPSTSMFAKALKIMMTGARTNLPLVTLPAISVPALSSITALLSYWEDRTRFIMSGNLTTAVATQQALNNPEREEHFIGLLPGDYLILPLKHSEELARELPNLDLAQGYLVRKDADTNIPLQARAQSAVPGITYASMRVSVLPLEASPAARPAAASANAKK